MKKRSGTVQNILILLGTKHKYCQRLKHLFPDRNNYILVVHQQDSSSAFEDRLLADQLFYDQFVTSRQKNFKRRPLFFFAGNVNISMVIIGDAVYGSQPEPCSPSNLLGRKKWLENSLLCFFIHTNTGISHINFYITSRQQFKGTIIIVFQHDVFRPDI